MTSRPIAAFVFPVRRTALFGSALLAAVVATALLSAGEARAALLNGPATCTGLGEGICLPGGTQEIFNEVFIVSDNDPLFNITADETAIILNFPDPVTGNDMDAVGFRLSNLQSNPDLVVGEITDVDFINVTAPLTRPFVTIDGGTGLGTIEWSLLNGTDPGLESVVRINLSFAPEPGTAALLSLGLAGLAFAGRRRGKHIA